MVFELRRVAGVPVVGHRCGGANPDQGNDRWAASKNQAPTPLEIKSFIIAARSRRVGVVGASCVAVLRVGGCPSAGGGGERRNCPRT